MDSGIVSVPVKEISGVLAGRWPMSGARCATYPDHGVPLVIWMHGNVLAYGDYREQGRRLDSKPYPVIELAIYERLDVGRRRMNGKNVRLRGKELPLTQIWSVYWATDGLWVAALPAPDWIEGWEGTINHKWYKRLTKDVYGQARGNAAAQVQPTEASAPEFGFEMPGNKLEGVPQRVGGTGGDVVAAWP